MVNTECKICFEKFDRVKQTPFILIPCGHTYCIVCINQLTEKKCPKCNGVIEDKKSNIQLLDLLELSSNKIKDDCEKAINQIESTKTHLKTVKENKAKQNGEHFKVLNGEINAKSEEIIKSIHSNQRKLLDQIKNFDSNPSKKLIDQSLVETQKMQLKIAEANVLLETENVDIDQLKLFLKEFTIQNENLMSLNDCINESDSSYSYELDSELSKLPENIIGKICEKKVESIKVKQPEIEQKSSINSNNEQTKFEILNYHMGEACKNLHIMKMNKAVEHLDEIIKLDPKFHDPFGKKGYALGHLLRYEESLQYFELSHKYNPNCAETYFHQGEAYRELSRYEESIISFKECIRLDPHYYQAYLEVARACAHIFKYEECLDYFSKASYLSQNDFNYAHYKGMALMGLKRYDESLAYLDAALKENPNDFQLYMAKAGTYTQMTKFDLALECHDKALELNPEGDYIRKARDELLTIKAMSRGRTVIRRDYYGD